ncbi:hypothetical protein DYB25_001865 [Aphanomyces astaci]|uniref:tRNA-uridine aminocarboxypropyltransferase 1 n=1 Tax=Aphanomyces astaci TaxID=112090 RepID=A0A397BM49_APHAT|nr:hypothetical protein DYB25_001865 [Aphanomyces astaci]
MEPTIEPDVAAPATTANAALTEEWKREECPGCKKSSKYYCVNCYVPIGAPSTVQVPRVRLPLRVDILFQDKIKKSTAPHGKVVAPDDISIIPYPFPSQNPPQYDVKEAVVVYPSINAVVIDELEDLDSVKTLIFIDCPWQKAPSILHDPALSHLRCVKLARPPLESKYWRYHSSGKGCISTIEGTLVPLYSYALYTSHGITNLGSLIP